MENQERDAFRPPRRAHRPLVPFGHGLTPPGFTVAQRAVERHAACRWGVWSSRTPWESRCSRSSKCSRVAGLDAVGPPAPPWVALCLRRAFLSLTEASSELCAEKERHVQRRGAVVTLVNGRQPEATARSSDVRAQGCSLAWACYSLPTGSPGSDRGGGGRNGTLRAASRRPWLVNPGFLRPASRRGSSQGRLGCRLSPRL